MSASRPGRGRDSFDPLSDLESFDKDFQSTTPKSKPASAAKTARRIEEMYEDVLDVAASLTSTLDLTDLLNKVVDGIIRVSHCERGFLMLKEPDGSFTLHIGRTRDREEWNEDHLKISRTIVAEVLETGKPFVGQDLSQVPKLAESVSILKHNLRSAICMPLNYKNDIMGVIYADSGFVVEEVLDAESPILKAFCAQASLAIENARRHGELRTLSDSLEGQNISLRHQLARDFSFAGMISKNKAMLEVFETVEKIAAHDINVMVNGESGTGKELLARAIHEKSMRAGAAFETVNCAGIPSGLVESILFGHKKGAFTGATRDKAGVFELADGGTLFLDEIGDMTLEVQPKILRAVQEGEIHRVGEEERVRKVDVRIISATHIDLNRAVGEGRFRQDLFFRLNAAQVSLPPLRNRREDIVPLAEFFLKKYSENKKAPLPVLARDAQEFLMSNPWVGNVRELKSAVEWGIVFQDDGHTIHRTALEKFFRKNQEGVQAMPLMSEGSLKAQVRVYEEHLIRRALQQNDYNITTTARALDISRQQLHNKIKRLGITTKPI